MALYLIFLMLPIIIILTRIILIFVMKRLKTILSKILEMPEAEINDDTSPGNASTWDSYNALLMVSEIEDRFQTKFTMEEVVKVECVRDIKELLKKHGIKLME